MKKFSSSANYVMQISFHCSTLSCEDDDDDDDEN